MITAMKNIIKNILAIAAVVTLATGCKGFLDEVDQSKFIASTADHFSSVLLGEFNASYESFRTNGHNAGLNYTVFMTDELRDGVNVNQNTSAREVVRPLFCWQRDIEKNMSDYTQIDYSPYWAYCYKMIAICNNIFENIDGVVEEVPGEKAFVTAEADFVSAVLYFYLVNLYAEPYRASTASQTMGVPIVAGTGVEDAYDRSMLDECYDKILALLNDALAKIEESGLDYGVTYKISEDAVRLLLSRVYLFMENWDKVIETLEPVMGHAYLQNIERNASVTRTFTEDSKEMVYAYGIWSYNNFDSFMTSNYFNVSSELYSLYEESDNRSFQWFTATLDKDKGEYVVTSTKNNKMCYTPGVAAMRYAEAYLNIAEAYARKGETAEAVKYLEKFTATRHMTGSVVTVPSDQKELVSFIFDERLREYCFEDFVRWFDLRRMPESERPELTHTFKVMQGSTALRTETYHLLQNDPNYTLSLPYKEKDNNPMIMDYDRFDKVPY